MKVRTLIEELGMTLITGDEDKEVSGIYACDLLSWVISHAKTGDLWVTVMNNVNIVAVASLAEVACIVLAEGVAADEQVVKKASENGVTLLGSSMPTAEIVVKASKLI